MFWARVVVELVSPDPLGLPISGGGRSQLPYAHVVNSPPLVMGGPSLQDLGVGWGGESSPMRARTSSLAAVPREGQGSEELGQLWMAL